jgi:hypothetical protein
VYRFTVFLFYSLILPSLCLSIFYVIKINLLYVSLVYVLYILHFICKVYKKHVLYGRLKGIRRVILTVSDFGFTHRLYSVTPAVRCAAPLHSRGCRYRHVLIISVAIRLRPRKF